ncbi:hypothetical protein [Micromonospora sp. DT62]|uniref:hypothetical protein n=1 Tax=Micromonospora sp. DT62 TaxID=3416521 RepID=UPI003CED7BAD
MATIEQIMDGIEARLATIPGLNVNDVTPGQITVPAAVVGLPTEVDYLRTFTDDNVDLSFNVMVLVSTAIEFAGQKALAGYLDKAGPSSILAALSADKTLGDLVDYCQLVSCSPQWIEFNGNAYYGAVFIVDVCSSGG